MSLNSIAAFDEFSLLCDLCETTRTGCNVSFNKFRVTNVFNKRPSEDR